MIPSRTVREISLGSLQPADLGVKFLDRTVKC